jgi:hypothetical protein
LATAIERPKRFSLANSQAKFHQADLRKPLAMKDEFQDAFTDSAAPFSTEAYVIDDSEIDTEKLNATVVGLAIRLAFLGAILFLSLSFVHSLRPPPGAWCGPWRSIQSLISSRGGSADAEDWQRH